MIDSLPPSRINTTTVNDKITNDKSDNLKSRSEPSSSQAGFNSVKQDQLTISKSAQSLQSSDTSAQRLEQLKLSIQNGTYQVNSSKIAEKLLKSVI